MKRALVLSLLVVIGLAFAGSAQLQGEWDSWLKIDMSPFGLGSFYSYLDIQYLVGGWTLEAAAVVNQAGLSDVWFEAYGSLGAFTMWSLIDFYPGAGGIAPQTPGFNTFENAVEISIAGVDVYALFNIQSGFGANNAVGSGFALGGIGTAGDIRIGVEVTSNLYPNLWFVFLYGLNGAVSDWTWTYCTSDIYNPNWYVGNYIVIQSGCDMAFSYLTGIAEFPICCADIYAMAEFSCTGFDYLSFLAKNIDLGIDWFNIYELGITYTVQTKSIAFSFKITAGDVVCFTPYFTILNWPNAFTLDGIELNALTLSCTLGGCEFYWGQIFEHEMTRYAGWEWPTTYLGGPYLDMYFFDAVGGGLSRYDTLLCVFDVACSYLGVNGYLYPNEMFGIQCDEDSCCGGLFSFGINNFFAANETALFRTAAKVAGSYVYTKNVPVGFATGIFGWMGSYIELSAGIGSNVSVVGGLKVTALNGTEFVTFGFQLTW